MRVLGRWRDVIGRLAVARRFDAKVAALASAYELPPERLGEIAALVKQL
jgi:hypothetical protein